MALILLYSTGRKMSTVPFSLLASNHSVIISLLCLADTSEKEEEKATKREEKKKKCYARKAINGEKEKERQKGCEVHPAITSRSMDVFDSRQ